jgi:hypothetical protein
MIGMIGMVFADLIKRAVSRQREFLADAAAVQFTRNPGGIAGALKVIGGFEKGSRVVNPGAVQASHLFFGNALKSFLATDWWATHPPLTERIRRIDPSFRGKLEKVDALALEQRNLMEAGAYTSALAAGGGTGFQPRRSGTAAQLGRPLPEHMQYARQLLGVMPQRLVDLVHEPFAARAIVYCLLLDGERSLRKEQLRQLHRQADPAVFQAVLDLEAECARLDDRLRLPLVDMAMPALEMLSEPQYRVFRANVIRLVRANDRLSLFEYVLHRVLLRHLDVTFGKPRLPEVRYEDLSPLLGDAQVVLSMLAAAGHRSEEDMQRAYLQAMAHLQVAEPVSRGRYSFRQLDAALEKMWFAAPRVKKSFLEACVICVVEDGRARAREVEMLRAIADGLGCPMPPLVDVRNSAPAEIEWEKDERAAGTGRP